MSISDEIIALWAELFPIAGYMAGLPQCKGRLFHPSDANLRRASADIAGLEARLDEISAPDLRTAASKLLRCFQAQLDSRLPPHGVGTCARGIFITLFKGEQTPDRARL
jgi:hypothetical protein